MSTNLHRPGLWRWLLSAAAIGLTAGAQAANELLPPGFRPQPPGVHALVGGRVVVRPGEAIEGGTVVIRDGFIDAAGKDVAVPADARVWDMKGTTVYAGFIDAYLAAESTNTPVATAESEPVGAAGLTAPGVKFFGAPGAQTDMGNPGPGYEVARVTPERRAVRTYSPTATFLGPLREQGFAAGLVVPARGIIRGTSALVALSDEDPNAAVIKPDVFQHVAFEPQRGREAAYPSSLMGVIAAVRQSFLDAVWYAADHADYRQHPAGRPMPEFNPALEALESAATKAMRVLVEPGSALMDRRATQLSRELNLDYCLVSCGQEWRRPDLVKADGGNYIVPVAFPALPKLPDEEDWEQVELDSLRAWDWAAENPALLRRQGCEVAFTTYGLSDKKKFRPNLRLALDRGFSETDAVAALTTVPAKLCGLEKLLGTIEPGKIANLTVVKGGSYFDPESDVREVWIKGKVYRIPSPAPTTEKDEKNIASEGNAGSQAKAGTGPVSKQPRKDAAEKGPKKEAQVREARKARVARSPLEGRGPIAEPKTVLVEHATIWTCGPEGRVEDADLLVADGKIKSVGKELRAQAETAGAPLVIDGRGLHVTPGLLDAHSHTAILGAVNEMTLPSTAMCRVSDVVNSETGNLYKQLAGGVTLVNLLHGSANPIGGQNCLIKLKDGAGPDELVFAAATPGIKFALGENVKQSNWGDGKNTRFPQTRMGVRTFIANRFTAAQEYLAARDAWLKGERSGKPVPRVDLELRALGEVLQGKRLIHCHAYRQDEILMLIRLAESFGIRIASFEHVLEGYKVADEMAKHGVAGSTFSDWWAYKFEVYDAIAFNGSLMRERGVRVAFNSDSSELARHLYTEAAKAVKYGDTPELEALKFVTINPATHLRVDGRVGSLEPGKDADFALWSKAPLDSGTVCLQTWIEGKKYFDRDENAGRVARLKQERANLVDKARRVAKLTGSGGGGEADKPDADDAFFRASLEHEKEGRAWAQLEEEQ